MQPQSPSKAPFHDLFFKAQHSPPSSPPFASLLLSLVSLAAFFSGLTSGRESYIRAHPEMCGKDLKKGLIYPQLPLFSFPSSQTWSLGSFHISVGYFSSPDEFFITRTEMTPWKKWQDELIFPEEALAWDWYERRELQMWETKTGFVFFVLFF